MENWDDYRVFLAVARATSVRRAATDLNVSHSTVLRRISNLEQSLETRLFDRTPSGYFTTIAGDELLKAVEKIEKETIRTGHAIKGLDKQINGTISITMPGIVATHLLMPYLATFGQTYPDIELSIISSYSDADLSRREADVAVRVSNDPPENLFGRRIVDVARAAYAHKSYLKNIRNRESIKSISWLAWPGMSPSQWSENSKLYKLPIAAIINDPHSTLAAIKAGMGVGILPCFVGDIEDELCRVEPETIQIYKSLWVLTHENLRNVSRIRILIRFLADAIANHRDLITGRNPKTS